MSNTLEGKVTNVGEKEIFPSGFEKRQMVITTLGDYPQTVPFDFVKDKTALLDGLTIGSVVRVFFDVRGKAGTTPGRYFVDLQGWKLESV